MGKTQARVLRKGRSRAIRADELAPGDILLLEQAEQSTTPQEKRPARPTPFATPTARSPRTSNNCSRAANPWSCPR
ncbi:hypothetical protein Thiowin_03503 [Thiorhodovibrio winogradskyi]|uniref:Uncharacterized protein n=1 Tax=Thiorhodovibrio winogradskyi TaxID=77007 RepID=A0ABZ0SFN0_9GAMM